MHGRIKIGFASAYGWPPLKATFWEFLRALEVSHLHQGPLHKASMLCSAELDQIQILNRQLRDRPVITKLLPHPTYPIVLQVDRRC